MGGSRFRITVALGVYLAALSLVGALGTGAHAASKAEKCKTPPPPPKATICHYPPGQRSKAQEISVATSAVSSHLAHGDFQGPCRQDCRRYPTVCDDKSACTADTCGSSGVCGHAAVSCNDGSACTTDSCTAAGGCKHDPVVCNDGTQCTTDSCNPTTGACVFSPISCDDQNQCTADSCTAEVGCRNDAVICDDGTQCTLDSCNPATGCAHGSVSCDDNSLCTADSCTAAGGCQHNTVMCDDGNRCTADSCNPATGCAHGTVSCDDNNKCTADSCNDATGCGHQPITCDSGQTCNPSTGDCITLSFTPVRSFNNHCVPFNYQDLIDNVPPSITTYDEAFKYCALLCVNNTFQGRCSQLWVAYTQQGTKGGPYWCLYGGPGPNTSGFDWYWTSSEIQCDYTPIPMYADWYSRNP